MILVDSVYVNEGGSLVLLKYLVSVLEKSNLEVFYLFDERVNGLFSCVESSRSKYIKNSAIERKRFYKKNEKVFKKILCFGSAPVPVKTHSNVYVYFHNPILLELHNNLKIKDRILYLIKQFYVGFYKKNVNTWLVQNETMKNKLKNKYLINSDDILILPFYPELVYPKNIDRIKNKFIYVSTYYPHKNHERLIEAFCQVYDETKEGSLVLTIPPDKKDIISLIEEKKVNGYPLDNIGFVDRNDLARLYKECQYLIFPSLDETFGLGLVEAIDAECNVLVADLPYFKDVCIPSSTFNPYSIADIKSCIINALRFDLNKSEKLIQNDIIAILNILRAQ